MRWQCITSSILYNYHNTHLSINVFINSYVLFRIRYVFASTSCQSQNTKPKSMLTSVKLYCYSLSTCEQNNRRLQQLCIHSRDFKFQCFTVNILLSFHSIQALCLHYSYFFLFLSFGLTINSMLESTNREKNKYK